MTTNEELLAQGRVNNSDSSGDEHEDDSSYDAGESENEEDQLTQLQEEQEKLRRQWEDSASDTGSSSSCSSSSSSNARKLTQLERERQQSSDSERRTGRRSSTAQSPDCLSPPGSPATPSTIFGNSESGPDTRLSHEAMKPCISESSSSEVGLPRCQALQRGPPVLEIQDLSTSSVEPSDEEGGDDGAPVQSMASQNEDSGSRVVDSFDYRRKSSPLSKQEILSLVFHDIVITHHVPRLAEQAFARLHDPDRPSDPRTTKRRLAALTGVEEIRYDCCLNGCISYALPRYADLTDCPINGCKQARLKANGDPYAQHAYIPISHRLRLMYSDKKRAREMMAYRAKMDEEVETGVCTIPTTCIRALVPNALVELWS